MKEKVKDIGLIGLAVMGENLARNIFSKGFKVVVNDLKKESVDSFVERFSSDLVEGAYDYKELAEKLSKPRKVFMMIKAGKPVDEVIEKLLPHLEKGDIIIDGGNSNFQDTIRRTKYVESKGLLYIGTGVSGGEEGALKGPSIMTGGSEAAWPYVKEIFQTISAQVDGAPCCDWMGSDGAGHYVKMIHNGIEYGDMQIISETYHIMKSLLGLDNETMAQIFSDWNKTELDSYLIEITSEIMNFKDEDGEYLLEKILDKAGQKGTGKWTGIASLDEGVPLTLITEAVYSRCLSSMKDERILASKAYKETQVNFEGDKKVFVEDLRKALYAAKIISYAQGYTLLKTAAKTYNWKLNYGKIAEIWRGGCIIRSAFLNKIKEAYEINPNLENLLLDEFFKKTIESLVPSWRKVVASAVMNGIPVPALSSALAYFDGYKTLDLPANLLQAQRDYFGAHTYERKDRNRGEFFHTNWTGRGGKTSSSTYNV